MRTVGNDAKEAEHRSKNDYHVNNDAERVPDEKDLLALSKATKSIIWKSDPRVAHFLPEVGWKTMVQAVRCRICLAHREGHR